MSDSSSRNSSHSYDSSQNFSYESDLTSVPDGDPDDSPYENPSGYESDHNDEVAKATSHEDAEMSDVSEDDIEEIGEADAPTRRASSAKVVISSLHHCQLTPHGAEMLAITDTETLDQMQPDQYSTRKISPQSNASDHIDFIPTLIAQNAATCLFPVIAQDDAIQLHINITATKSSSRGATLSKVQERNLIFDLRKSVEAFFEKNTEALGLHRVRKDATSDPFQSDFSLILELIQIDDRSPIHSKDPLATLHAIDLSIRVNAAAYSRNSTLYFSHISTKLIDQLVKFSRKHLVGRYKALFNGAFRTRMDKCLHHMDRIASIMAEINSAFEAHKDGRKGFETDMVDTKQSEEMRKNKEEMLRKDLEGYFCSSFKPDFNREVYKARLSRKLKIEKATSHLKSPEPTSAPEESNTLLDEEADDFEVDNAGQGRPLRQSRDPLPPFIVSNVPSSGMVRREEGGQQAEGTIINDDEAAPPVIERLPITSRKGSNEGAEILEAGRHICPSSGRAKVFRIVTQSDFEHRQRASAKECNGGEWTHREEERLSIYKQYNPERGQDEEGLYLDREMKAVDGARRTRKVKDYEDGCIDEIADKFNIQSPKSMTVLEPSKISMLQWSQEESRERQQSNHLPDQPIRPEGESLQVVEKEEEEKSMQIQGVMATEAMQEIPAGLLNQIQMHFEDPLRQEGEAVPKAEKVEDSSAYAPSQSKVAVEEKEVAYEDLVWSESGDESDDSEIEVVKVFRGGIGSKRKRQSKSDEDDGFEVVKVKLKNFPSSRSNPLDIDVYIENVKQRSRFSSSYVRSM